MTWLVASASLFATWLNIRRVRTCFAMEIDPRYVDVAVTRWEEFTGKKAERCA